jgi:tetratricopeptide (TPR) repeat protein
MKFHGLLLAAALLAASGQWAMADSTPQNNGNNAPPPAVAKEFALIDQANAKLDAKDWHGAAALLSQIAKDEGFSLLSDETQYQVYHFLSVASYLDNDNDTAWQAVQMAVRPERAVQGDWYIRFDVALRRDDDDASVDSLTTLAERFPTALANVANPTVYYVVRQAKKLPIGEERQAKLLRALFADHWKPQDAEPGSADGLWLDLMRYYLKGRQDADAKAVASVITNPDVIIAMRAEMLFDALTAADPGHYDIDAAFDRELAANRAWMDSHPDELGPIVSYALLLVERDRPSEALPLLDRALARAGSASHSPFSDYAHAINWVYDTRARALMSLDRVDEGLAQLAKGAALEEDGGTVNVSQTINLADAYYLLGRPQEALATLARLDRDSGSPYGRMAYEEARGCAYAEINDTAGLARTMAYVNDHVIDAPGVKANILICAGDLDGAAAALIANLGDPDLASNTLRQLQIYRKPAAVTHPSAFEQLLDQRRDALRARADLKVAIDKVGRILTLPVLDLE